LLQRLGSPLKRAIRRLRRPSVLVIRGSKSRNCRLEIELTVVDSQAKVRREVGIDAFAAPNGEG
jgi:hypothetical protein